MLWIMETVLLERSLPSMKVMFTGGGLKDKTAENAQAETCKSLWYTHYPELEKKLAIWIAEKCQAGSAVSTNVICLKARLVAQKSGLGEQFRATKS